MNWWDSSVEILIRNFASSFIWYEKLVPQNWYQFSGTGFRYRVVRVSRFGSRFKIINYVIYVNTGTSGFIMWVCFDVFLLFCSKRVLQSGPCEQDTDIVFST